MSRPVDLICGVQISVAGILEQTSLLTGFPCRFIFDTAQNPFYGGENIVFVVEDSRLSRVAVRIPRLEASYAARVVEIEVLHRLAIEYEGIDRVQSMIDYSTSCENPIKTPFIALKWADGTHLQWTDSEPADERDRNKVIHAIAQISMDLLIVRQKGIS